MKKILKQLLVLFILVLGTIFTSQAQFDLDGRLITTLANEEMQAGVHEIRWNANNANGKPVPSRVYLLRIEAGTFKETKKVFVI